MRVRPPQKLRWWRVLPRRPPHPRNKGRKQVSEWSKTRCIPYTATRRLSGVRFCLRSLFPQEEGGGSDVDPAALLGNVQPFDGIDLFPPACIQRRETGGQSWNRKVSARKSSLTVLPPAGDGAIRCTEVGRLCHTREKPNLEDTREPDKESRDSSAARKADPRKSATHILIRCKSSDGSRM